jgi:hypothetical protein
MAMIANSSASQSCPFSQEGEETRVDVLGAAVRSAFKNARREGSDTEEHMLAHTFAYVTERLRRINEVGRLYVTGSVGTGFFSGVYISDIDLHFATENPDSAAKSLAELVRNLSAASERSCSVAQVVGPYTIGFVKNNGKKQKAAEVGKYRARCELTFTRCAGEALAWRAWLMSAQTVQHLPEIVLFVKLVVSASNLPDEREFKLPSIAITALVAAALQCPTKNLGHLCLGACVLAILDALADPDLAESSITCGGTVAGITSTITKGDGGGLSAGADAACRAPRITLSVNGTSADVSIRRFDLFQRLLSNASSRAKSDATFRDIIGSEAPSDRLKSVWRVAIGTNF